MRTMNIALMGAAIVFGATQARAQTDVRMEPIGRFGKGDARTDLRCGAGRFIVGFDGASGTNLDRIRLLCATVAPDTAAGPIDDMSVPIGGPGGGVTKATCPDGMYVFRIEVKPTVELKQVERIFARCTSRGKTGGFEFGTTGPDADRAKGTLPYIFECPVNAAATGLILRYGKHINDAGLICGAFYVPPPPTPPAPPPPLPKPPKVIVNPGAEVKMPSFVGRWKLTSRSGHSLTLDISEGDANDIFGTLSSGDPKYNGVFTGVVGNRGRNFTFTYRDAATGNSGSGKMLYRGVDPDGIIGGIKSDGPPPVEEVWGGVRQK